LRAGPLEHLQGGHELFAGEPRGAGLGEDLADVSQEGEVGGAGGLKRRSILLKSRSGALTLDPSPIGWERGTGGEGMVPLRWSTGEVFVGLEGEGWPVAAERESKNECSQ